MRFSTIAATVIACTTPVVTLAPVFTQSARATYNDIPATYYGDSRWSVTITRTSQGYSYTGINQRNGQSINLYGV
jgi:hypothetical protein